MHRLISLYLLVLAGTACCQGQPRGKSGSGAANPLPAAQGQTLVARALANEYASARDSSHPMRYDLLKTSPRLSTTKKICETRDGDVARLVAVNGKPLSAIEEQKEDARLAELLNDPAKQKRRKQGEDDDEARVLKVLRALPSAFVYQDEGPGEVPSGRPGVSSSGKPGVSPASRVEKFAFRPNPGFSPPDLETQILTQMTGEIWIDPINFRVVRLEGHLQRDVDFGWGILGRLNQGGWIVIEQADVGPDMGVDQWRTVHFQMKMSGRVVFKTRVFDTTEDESGYQPVPVGLGYQKAIEMLRRNQ